MHRKQATLLLIVAAAAISSLLASNLPLPVIASAEQQDINLDKPAVPFTQADTNLRIRDSQIRVDGELLFSLSGVSGGHVIWFHSPKYGRYIFSTRPHPKYEFEQVKVIDNRRIVFSSGGKQFEWIVNAPLVENGTITHLWMMHDKHPEPTKDGKEGGGEIGSATHYEYLFRHP